MNTREIKIIVVDDNKSFRIAVINYLKIELGYETVIEASSGAEFLDLIKKNNGNCIVLMDLQMPGMDGIEATKNWCLPNPGTKVIAVTIHMEKAHLKKLIESGFKGCVSKVYFFPKIDKAIEKVANGGYFFEDSLPIN